MGKAKLRKSSFNWHRKLAWLSLIALLLFMGSAVTHPILSWTGPKATKFRPPTAYSGAADLQAIAPILKRHNINLAQVVKLVPGTDGVLLQVTENPIEARRYFDLSSGEEIANHDEQHAVWLANYYFGREAGNELPLKSVEFISEFDSAYPWVNRLLPVYRIQFADEDNTSAYIYTELNALASVGNDYKTQMQAIFRNLHTWSWLNKFEYARIIIMALMLGSATLMILAGIGLLILLKSRKNMSTQTRVHRVLAYIIALPLLGFCVSGFYHLLHYGLVDTHRGMIAPRPISLGNLKTTASFDGLPNAKFNHVSLTQHNNGLFYRISLPSTSEKARTHTKQSGGEHAHHSGSSVAERSKTYKGREFEQGGIYYNANTGKRAKFTDQEVAIALASAQLGISKDLVLGAQKIKRFGLHYDFRNKRLPVWQVDTNTENGDKLFIDPATGTMVDRLVNRDRYEGYSFSFLHKWNFLTPFTGRFWRDVLIVFVLGLSLIVSLLGLQMKLRN